MDDRLSFILPPINIETSLLPMTHLRKNKFFAQRHHDLKA